MARRRIWTSSQRLVRPALVSGSVVSLFLLAGMISILYPGQPSDSAHAQDDQITAAMLSGGLICGSVFAYRVVVRLRRWRSSTPSVGEPVKPFKRLRDLTYPLQGPFVFALILAGGGALLEAFYRTLTGGEFLVKAISWSVLWICLITFNIVSGQALTRSHARMRAYPHALDEPVRRCVRLIADAEHLAKVWDRPDTSRHLINRLEELAAHFDASTWARQRAPFVEPGLRADARKDWRRIAQVFRAHKSALGKARTRAEYDAVIASLSAGALAMARQDWRALLANAPGTARHATLRSGWLLTGLAPAVVLGVCAFALPEVQPFRSAPASSIDGLRATLVVYALVTLIPRQGSLVSLLTTSMAKGEK